MFDKVSKTAIRVAGVQIIHDFKKKNTYFCHKVPPGVDRPLVMELLIDQWDLFFVQYTFYNYSWLERRASDRKVAGSTTVLGITS